MKRCSYPFIWLLIGALLLYSLTVVSAQGMTHYTDERTGVEITGDADEAMFPPTYTAPPISARGTSLHAADMERVLGVMRTALVKYPPAFVRKNLKTIYVVQKLTEYNTIVGGLGWAQEKRLYLNYAGDNVNFTNAYFEAMMHHEFAHILLKNYSDRFSVEKWQQLNPPDFHYGATNVKGVADNMHKGRFIEAENPVYLKQGFVNEYATYEVNEDIASTAEYLFAGTPQFWEAADQNAIVKKKVDRLIAFYHALDSTFTETYFRQRAVSIPIPAVNEPQKER